MGFVIYWSDFAKFQLKEIGKYYKKNTSLKIAKNIISDVIKETDKLKNNEDLGQKETLLLAKSEKYRYIVKGNFKIIYFYNLNLNSIEIVDVFDCRQNPEKIKQSK